MSWLGGSTRFRAARGAGAALALALALILLLAPVAEARRVRVFAVGPKTEVERWLDTRRHFHDKWFALFDGGLRGKPGTPLIQRGAGDVASHLLGPADRSKPVETARDLVALPEDAGLWAMLAGSRGAQARATPPAPGSSAAAIASLAGPYAPLVQYYSAKFPELGARGVPARLLMVALTDTFARVAVETFAELADRYDVYLEAGVNMARDWRLVCNDARAFNAAKPPRLPGGVRCEATDPARVGRLRDPDEPARDYAYEATSPDAVNMALIFDPDGRLISKQVKAYLTPPELPGVGLDLRPGEVSGLTAVRTPVGTLGVLTSKDAWMPDLLGRLDQQGADLLIQPEYFAGNLVATEGPWSPDVLHAAGYNDVLRLPSLEAMVLPELTGNVFDLSADHQSHIAVRVRSKRSAPGPALVGQPAQRGFARVARWVVPDPLRPGEPFDARRRRLGEAGEKLPYDSPVACRDPAEAGPCRNGQVEDVVFADVEVDRSPPYRRRRGRRARTRFSPSRPLAPAPAPQRRVALAAAGRRAVAAYEQRSGGGSVVSVVRSRDGGRTFGRPVRPAGAGAPNQWTPSLAISGRRVFVAWTDERGGVRRAYVAVSRDGGRRFGPPVPVSPAAPGAAAPGSAAASPTPSRQWAAVLAPAPDGGAYLAYLDERQRSADDSLPQSHLYFARVGAGGGIGGEIRLDCQPPAFPNPGACAASEHAAKLDNSWAPAIASAGGRVAVAWVDFRTYDWRPYLRVSDDGGRSFGPEEPLGNQPEPDEQLADTPAVAIGRGGRLFAAWNDWRKSNQTATRPGSAYDTWLALPGGTGELRVDDLRKAQASTFYPALAADRLDALVAWQDSSTAGGDIKIARIAGGLRRRRAHRVDDSGESGSNQYRPALAAAGGRLIVAWEDERDGPPNIYLATAPLRAIR